MLKKLNILFVVLISQVVFVGWAAANSSITSTLTWDKYNAYYANTTITSVINQGEHPVIAQSISCGDTGDVANYLQVMYSSNPGQSYPIKVKASPPLVGFKPIDCTVTYLTGGEANSSGYGVNDITKVHVYWEAGQCHDGEVEVCPKMETTEKIGVLDVKLVNEQGCYSFSKQCGSN
jgi:hypothetical protein